MSDKDESFLARGLSSAATEKVNEARKQHSEVKSRKRSQIELDADFIKQTIQKEKEAIPTKIWELTNNETPAETIKSTLSALRLYESYLDNLSNQLANVLRNRKVEVDEDEQ